MDFFQKLNDHISIHPSRLECIFHMINGLCQFQSVAMHQMAYAIPGTAAITSKTRRIQRFFQLQILDYLAIGRLISRLFNLPSKVVLTIDRTDWKFGKHPINILFIGVMVGDMSIPLVFMNLAKKGNSNNKERCKLIRRVLKIISANRIECLLGDREFIGRDWFKALIKAKIPFAIRIKSNTIMYDPRTKNQICVRDYYRSVKLGSYVIETIIWEQKIRLMFVKKNNNTKKALFMAVSSEDFHICWLKKYRKRWSIERMFLSMKTHGFNMEQTHITIRERINKLVAIMAIAFAVCCKAGQYHESNKQIPVKNHGRKLYSIFTYGL